jgi:hypothetical protein
LECGKIVITRLRNTEYYKGEPLNHIVDSIYYLLNQYVVEHDSWPPNIDTHNCSIPSREKNRNTIRDYQRITDADVLIIPSENEFSYNISGRMSNIMLGRGWNIVKSLKEALLENPKPRKVILITSDKADTKELYENVFNDVPNLKFERIDESEFPGGIHHLKYLEIEKLTLDTKKNVDFGYWGTSKKLKVDYSAEKVKTPIHDWYDKDAWVNKKERILKGNMGKNRVLSRYMNNNKPGEILPTYKEQRESGIIHPDYPGEPRFYAHLLKGKQSNDERHIILKQIYNDESITNNMIGYFDDFEYTHKFDKKMTNILPHIAECKTTLCFNWPGQEDHLTSRYNEALGCDVIPLVWKDYDCNNQLVYSDWQRCYSFEDIKRKCLELSDNHVRLLHLNEIKNKYLEVTKPLKHYEELFNKKLNEKLNNGD